MLGYRTSPSEYKNKAKRDVAIEKATKTATAMKQDGWTFASHSWGHINMTDSPLAQIKKRTTHCGKRKSRQLLVKLIFSSIHLVLILAVWLPIIRTIKSMITCTNKALIFSATLMLPVLLGVKSDPTSIEMLELTLMELDLNHT
ncbi:polysaccharide deacetylase family protein [Lacticaseibacillus manihotivorans]|uniref:polysaccharide deacetylase family protein n=1 Tax=Lacticaseibacillus manihotivorans TaxID=88233 RepID=UPI000AFA2269|nr:polysaccharide deacetylase family protein [Lacticaseibacillus manihotivorans]